MEMFKEWWVASVSLVVNSNHVFFLLVDDAFQGNQIMMDHLWIIITETYARESSVGWL